MESWLHDRKVCTRRLTRELHAKLICPNFPLTIPLRLDWLVRYVLVFVSTRSKRMSFSTCVIGSMYVALPAPTKRMAFGALVSGPSPPRLE